jgi:hypothetical protein
MFHVMHVVDKMKNFHFFSLPYEDDEVRED